MILKYNPPSVLQIHIFIYIYIYRHIHRLHDIALYSIGSVKQQKINIFHLLLDVHLYPVLQSYNEKLPGPIYQAIGQVSTTFEEHYSQDFSSRYALFEIFPLRGHIPFFQILQDFLAIFLCPLFLRALYLLVACVRYAVGIHTQSMGSPFPAVRICCSNITLFKNTSHVGTPFENIFPVCRDAKNDIFENSCVLIRFIGSILGTD